MYAVYFNSPHNAYFAPKHKKTFAADNTTILRFDLVQIMCIKNIWTFLECIFTHNHTKHNYPARLVGKLTD